MVVLRQGNAFLQFSCYLATRAFWLLIFMFGASAQLPGETDFYEGLDLVPVSSMPLWMSWLTFAFVPASFLHLRELTLPPLLLPLAKGCT